MKAILLRQPGGPTALEYVELPTPVPGDGEVLVQADTIGVSMPEVLVRKGVYNWMPPLPAIPGIEMSGTVVSHGRNVAAPAIGQPVFVSARDLPVRAGCQPLIHERLRLAEAARAHQLLEVGAVIGKLLLKP